MNKTTFKWAYVQCLKTIITNLLKNHLWSNLLNFIFSHLDCLLCFDLPFLVPLPSNNPSTGLWVVGLQRREPLQSKVSF